MPLLIFSVINRAADEQDHQQNRPDKCEIDPLAGSRDAEQVKTDPDSLLGGKVGMTDMFPQTFGEESFLQRLGVATSCWPASLLRFAL
ncbi:MAG: hypothetical protein MZV63_00630 [Marinilabiliales bacterium]|nr:hypothetical protein [Marinilabiliales bacterium]